MTVGLTQFITGVMLLMFTENLVPYFSIPVRCNAEEERGNVFCLYSPYSLHGKQNNGLKMSPT